MDGRDKDTPINLVRQGGEPYQFTKHFLNWEHKNLDNDNDNNVIKELTGIKGNQEIISLNSNDINKILANDGYLDPKTNKFSIKELIETFPSGVKPTEKES